MYYFNPKGAKIITINFMKALTGLTILLLILMISCSATRSIKKGIKPHTEQMEKSEDCSEPKQRFNKCRDLLVKCNEQLKVSRDIHEESLKDCPVDYKPWGVSGVLLIIIMLL